MSGLNKYLAKPADREVIKEEPVEEKPDKKVSKKAMNLMGFLKDNI